MLSKSIDVAGIKATIHTDTGRSYLAKRVVYRKITIDTDNAQEVEEWVAFARALTQSTDVVVPFPWPTPASSLEELMRALNCWLDLPRDVLAAWDDALTEVDTAPVADADLSSDTPKNS